MSKLVSSVDIEVGRRVRIRRLSLGMSQEKLASNLGVTFQQVQKYEKGVNRVGAGRLHQIAQTLTVPVSYFFDGIDNNFKNSKTLPSDLISEFLSDPTAHKLIAAFVKVKAPSLRRKLVLLVEGMTTAEP